MEEKIKKFIAHSPANQKEVDMLVKFLAESGMSDEDIQKIGEYKNSFTLNPKYPKKEKSDSKDELPRAL